MAEREDWLKKWKMEQKRRMKTMKKIRRSYKLRKLLEKIV